MSIPNTDANDLLRIIGKLTVSNELQTQRANSLERQLQGEVERNNHQRKRMQEMHNHQLSSMHLGMQELRRRLNVYEPEPEPQPVECEECGQFLPPVDSYADDGCSNAAQAAAEPRLTLLEREPNQAPDDATSDGGPGAGSGDSDSMD